MKKHFTILFDPTHRWLTISLLFASALLIIASQIIGTTDSLPGIAALMTGMICLFFALLHPWKKSTNYGILAGSSLGMILLTFLIIHILASLKMESYISEGVVMIFIGLICLPGIIAGIIGTIFWSIRSK